MAGEVMFMGKGTQKPRWRQAVGLRGKGILCRSLLIQRLTKVAFFIVELLWEEVLKLGHRIDMAISLSPSNPESREHSCCM